MADAMSSFDEAIQKSISNIEIDPFLMETS